MTLQQFASDDDPNIVHADEAMRSRLLRPGDRVTNERDGGEGIVVAIVGDRIHDLWAVEPSFRFQLPKIRTLRNYRAIAQALVQVEPMPMPTGSVFYLDYTYGSGSLGDGCKPTSDEGTIS